MDAIFGPDGSFTSALRRDCVCVVVQLHCESTFSAWLPRVDSLRELTPSLG